MDPAAFQQQLRWLTAAPPGDAWFAILRNVYRQPSRKQREQLRHMLGSSDEDCHEPDDAFAADFADRHRLHVRTAESFRLYLLSQANGSYLEDSRDALLHIAGLYYLLILRGFEPDVELNSVANTCAPNSASTLRSFVRRPDKELALWRYEAVRRADGSVTLQCLGI